METLCKIYEPMMDSAEKSGGIFSYRDFRIFRLSRIVSVERTGFRQSKGSAATLPEYPCFGKVITDLDENYRFVHVLHNDLTSLKMCA